MDFFKNNSKAKFLIFGLFFLIIFFTTYKFQPVNEAPSINSNNKGQFSSDVVSGEYDSVKINIEESKLYWIGRKIHKDHRGTINIKNGTVFIKDNRLMEAYLKVDMNSIECTDIENEKSNRNLVKHLKNEDFFEVNKYPYSEIFLKFNLMKESSVNLKQSYNANGDIVIKGIRQPISNDFFISYKNNIFSTTGEIDIDRTAFNIKYSSGRFFPELADRAILDNFTIKFELNTES